jgi:hypothetical protein
MFLGRLAENVTGIDTNAHERRVVRICGLLWNCSNKEQSSFCWQARQICEIAWEVTGYSVADAFLRDPSSDKVSRIRDVNTD